MNLTKKHIFIILLLSIVFCCSLGSFGLVEGMENKDKLSTSSNNKKDKNTGYTPQSSIINNEYSSYQPVEGADGLIRVISTDDGRVIYATPENTVNGISGRKIPPGQEDLYILKSEIVPPVCPACPTVINKCEENKKCAPCPPCGRCPEPSFECVKRPTYKPDNPYLPMPVLADFSSFGM